MRIGIILTGDYGWAGGLYYSLNIIKLLSRIEVAKNIQVVAIVNASTPSEVLNDLPKHNVEIYYLDQKPFFYRLFYKFFGNRFVADINALKLDVLYPLIAYDPAHTKLNCKVLYWLYDFQHKFLPDLFSDQELKSRDVTFQNIASFGKDVVFSSYDSKDHFNTFYPDSNANKHVYNFVSLLEKEQDYKQTDFNITGDYFIVCNQFWPHKNHIVVLKALDLLLKEKRNIKIVFTGRYNDERNKMYVDELKAFILEHQLEKNILLTGFISRNEQVNLMKHAKAIIQPSFFEGWSTVVEDAKTLNKFLIVSDIQVNREQIKNDVLFFDPKDHLKLADHLSKLNDKKNIKTLLDYNENIEDSKNALLTLFKI